MTDREINLENEYKRITGIFEPDFLHCLMSDALHLIEEQHKLLKEQDAVKIEVKKINNSGRCGRCPNCLMELNEVDYPNYCGNCGQAVKWE